VEFKIERVYGSINLLKLANPRDGKETIMTIETLVKWLSEMQSLIEPDSKNDIIFQV
jgi:hypothetical protein